MDTQLLIICGLTFVIHVVATLAYAMRIAGVLGTLCAQAALVIVRVAELI